MTYQEIADNICKEFKLPYIPITFDDGTKAPLRLGKSVLGAYYGYVIKLRDYASVDTLLHELAHHKRIDKKIHGKIFKKCFQEIKNKYKEIE